MINTIREPNLNPDAMHPDVCYCENCNAELSEDEYKGFPAWVCHNCGCVEIECEGDLLRLHDEYVRLKKEILTSKGDDVAQDKILKLHDIGKKIIELVPPKKNSYIVMDSSKNRICVVVCHYTVLDEDYMRMKDEIQSDCYDLNNEKYII